MLNADELLIAERLNRDFFNPSALFELGKLFHARGLHGLSTVLESAAIDARTMEGLPFPEAMLVMGACYKAVGHRSFAEQIWLDALKDETLPEGRAQILHNLSGIALNDGRPEVALRYADEALDAQPDNPGAAANRGLACLEMGRWREGWQGFEKTYATGDRVRRSYGKLPIWSGTPGQRVIVYGDQGLGDEIMFANSLPDMIGECQRVLLDCHPRLTTLFRHSFPDCRVHGTRKTPTTQLYWEYSDYDAVIGLSDLPRFFRNEEADWRGGEYLLKTPQGRARGKRFERVGFAWKGGTPATRGDVRSVPLELLEPIFRDLQTHHKADLYSLNYQPETKDETQRYWKKSGIDIKHLPDKVQASDYATTAEFVNSLDLVITVCTTIHHLAGALGVPCWTLVPSKPSWRYQTKGDRLPWYDSVRLFRQEKDGDWC